MELLPIEYKEYLARKIHRISNENLLQNIETIIRTNNPNLEIVETMHGKFLYFDSLTNDTYHSIASCIDNFKKKKKRTKLENTLRVIIPPQEIPNHTERNLKDFMLSFD